MLNEDATRDFIEVAVPRLSGKPLVIDAIASAALRSGRHRFTDDTDVVLTPNRREMALTDRHERRNGGQSTLVQSPRRRGDLNAIVALKGPRLSDRDPRWGGFPLFRGRRGLATSGSGDVLAGTVIGLLARGAELDQAAVWATISTAPQAIGWRADWAGGFLARELSEEIPGLMNGLAVAISSADAREVS